jgi:hypothetical protein
MSRVLSPTGSFSGQLSNGGTIVGSFNDLAKPIDGGWVLKVNLAKSEDCPVSALIELFQDQGQADRSEVVIVSTTISPTMIATDYELTVSEGQLSSLAVGRCHLSELKVRVKASISDCPSTNCCPSQSIPSTLTAMVASSAVGIGGTSITLNWFPAWNAWRGAEQVCGNLYITVTFGVYEDSCDCYCNIFIASKRLWEINEQTRICCPNDYGGGGAISECNPFEATIMCYVAGLDLCTECFDSYDQYFQLTITE